MAKEKKSSGEDVTALTPEDFVKAYEETHPKRKDKKKTEEQAASIESKELATKESASTEIQLSDLEQLKKDVDSALTLLPRVKALLAQIVILPDNQTVKGGETQNE